MALKISNTNDTGGGDKDTAEVHGNVVVKDRFDINIDQPLPALDNAPALAFRVTPRRDVTRSMYALVCDPKLPPRTDLITTVQKVKSEALFRVVDWSIVDWAPENRRCPVVILEQPKGERVFQNSEHVRERMNEEELARHFIVPVAELMVSLSEHKVTHRAIRPDNLFFTDDTKTTIQLGECLSSPPAMVQPVICEPLDSAMSAPGGRGVGRSKDDMYALGVCILTLLAGEYPLKGMSDDEIIEEKTMMGSFGAMTQIHRVSATMAEVLHGLLNDNYDERWDIDDLIMWANGRRLSPKHSAVSARATRAYVMDEKEYWTARSLARAMSLHWEEAKPVLNDGSLDGWLRRSLGEEAKIEAVNSAKMGLPPEEDDRMLARTIIALDPSGPIRLRGLAATIWGLGSFAAHYADQGEARSAFTGLVTMSLGQFWLDMQMLTRVDPQQEVAKIEKQRPTLLRVGSGYGLERVIYELNMSYPCRSPMFDRDYVPTLEHVLPALERLAAPAPKEMSRLVDREIAAFVATHSRRAVADELRAMDDADTALAGLGQVRLLAILQDAHSRGIRFPAVSEAAANLLMPMVERFNSRTARRMVQEKLNKAASEGRLDRLVEIADDLNALESDNRAYLTATNFYTKTALDLLNLRRDVREQKTIAGNIGGQISSGIAGIFASVACVIFAAIKLI